MADRDDSASIEISRHSTPTSIYSWLMQLVGVTAEEVRPVCWAFSYFFFLLCSYYILRPIRDEMGIAGGVENLQWLFTGTFVAMLAVVPLFGWISSRYPRQKFLPYIYLFFIVNLLLFFMLFQSDISRPYVARIFYIWVSVFNLFVVSVFWSFMADIFNNEQAKRLFGFIAAGGTSGALAGPFLTTILVEQLGPENLMLLSALLLGWAVLCIQQLNKWQMNQSLNKAGPATATDKDRVHNIPMGGGIFAGIRLVFNSPYLSGICLLILLYTTLSTFIYFQQAQIIRDSFSDPPARIKMFASIDLAVNALTIGIQLFLTGRIVKRFGIATTLALIPLCLAVGFISLWYAPVLMVLVVVQVTRRAGNYAIMRPAREMLYVVLGKEEKYKAKNFIDTAVYRGGDVFGAWVYAGLRGIGLTLSGIALIAVPVAAMWACVAFKLGKRQEQLALQTSEKTIPEEIS